MRPKGWRLDPAWREHFAKIEQERMERRALVMKMEIQNRQLQEDLEYSLRKTKPSYIIANDLK